jgi:hypothetical protein
MMMNNMLLLNFTFLIVDNEKWMKNKWLENEARLNDTGNDWSCSPELCSRDSSATQVAQPVVCVKRLELTRP